MPTSAPESSIQAVQRGWTVYEAPSRRRRAGREWLQMIRELWNARELVIQLAKRDLAAKYRQSILGYVWAVVFPVIAVAFFTFMTSHRALPIGKAPLPYPVFAIWSLSVWQLFAVSLGACTESLIKAGQLVTKINFPKEALVIAAPAQAIFDFFIKLLLSALVFAWFGVLPYSMSLFIIAILPLVLLLAVGFGFIFAVGNLVFRDVGNIVAMATTFGVFAAPVLYPPPVSYPFYLVNILNPLSPLLIATQDLIAFGEIRAPGAFCAAAAFSVLAFFVGWRMFRLILPRVIERA